MSNRRTSVREAIVEDDPNWLVRFPDGRVLRDASIAVTEDEFQKMCQGYMCVSCFEPLDPPFPEICPLRGCGFPVKAEQLREIEARYGGDERIGPSKEWLEGLDAAS